MNQQTTMKRELAAALLAKAETDPAFRKELLKNAKSAVERVLGGALPPGLQIKALEETDSLLYLILPPAAEGEMSDAELSGVSGGMFNIGGFAVLQSFLKREKGTSSQKSTGPGSSGPTINTTNTVGGGIKQSDMNPVGVTFPNPQH